MRKLLLPLAELESIVGTPGMTNTDVFSAPDHSPSGATPSDCGGVALPAKSFETAEFASREFAGEADGVSDSVAVAQVMVVLETADDASEEVASAARLWRYCPEGRPYTQFIGNTIRHRVPGPVDERPGRISVTVTTQETSGRCHHVMASKGPVVVETLVCDRAGDPVAASNQIADRLLAALPG